MAYDGEWCDLRWLPNLTYLNLENNALVKLPAELGLSGHIKVFSPSLTTIMLMLRCFFLKLFRFQ